MKRGKVAEENLEYLEKVREKAQSILYYSEGEDLLKRENKKGGWNTLEIIFHINKLNQHYLGQLEDKVEGLPKANSEELKLTYLGSLMIKSFKPGESSILSRKFSSPAKIHPLKLKEKGFPIVENVVFRDFVNDLDTLESYFKKLEQLRFESLKVKTLLPFLKVNGADCLLLTLAHTDRHLNQAQRLLG